MTQPFTNITSANSTIILIAETVFPVGVQLENFSTDQMFSADEVEIAQARMGVDGGLAAGYVPNQKNVTITLEAGSPSTKYLQTLWQTVEVNRTVYKISLVCTVPSIGQVYTWSNGVMIRGNPIAQPKKILDPTSWGFTFANLNIVNI